MNITKNYSQIGSESGSGIIYQTYGNPIGDAVPKKPGNANEPKCTKNLGNPNPHFKEPCQTHDHEFEGSTKLAEQNDERHNHRFAGVSSQAIPFGISHVHGVFTNTDFFEDHHHAIAAISGPAIPVGEGKHVHFADFVTTLDDGHLHKFQFASLIEDPLDEPFKKRPLSE